MDAQRSETIRLELPADHRYLNILSANIEALLARIDGIKDREVLTYNIQLAAHEACTNIIDHAYPANSEGRVLVLMTFEPDTRKLIINLHDSGEGFDPATIEAPNLEVAQEHGYGLFLMYNLMDEVTYTTKPGDNHWRLVKSIDSEQSMS